MSNSYEWLNREKQRYYKITIHNQPNEIILNYSWGGCNSNRGGRKQLSAHNHEEVQSYINIMIKRRKSRGYELVRPDML